MESDSSVQTVSLHVHLLHSVSQSSTTRKPHDGYIKEDTPALPLVSV